MRNDKEVSKALYINGMKLIEISDKLDISINTLKSWSSLDKWTDSRIKEDSINNRVTHLINTHLESIEGKENISRDEVTILKELMTIRQNNHVSFIDKVKLMKELTEFAIINSKHSDSQTIAFVSHQYITDEYEKLED